MKHLADYINILIKRGRYAFTMEDARAYLQCSESAFRVSVHRLKSKGSLISLAQGLYFIVTAEHAAQGSLPPAEVVPLLMKYKKLEYYACLLTAAEYHGAAHQKPQVFQVITNQQLKPIQLGNIVLRFLYKKNLQAIPTQEIVTKTGYLKISTPEATAMDLFLYPKHSGGLNHIATVMSELIEVMDAQKLTKLVQNSKSLAWVQRMGYILEQLEPFAIEKRNAIVKALQSVLKNKKLPVIPLASELSVAQAPKDPIWQVIVNTTIESDL